VIFVIFALILLACGCSIAETIELLKTTAPASISILPAPTPSPWTFGDVSKYGDIEINSVVLDELKPRTYEFSHTPTVLIYHTHATEAFLQTEDYTYEESAEWRTEDNEKNIVHVGEVLKAKLEALGFNVIHDTTNVEPPEITSAYSRSLDVMKAYEDVDIYIDVHRNAAEVGVAYNTAVYGGETCARMFFVVGTGVGTYEGEYDIAPDWKANYTFALTVHKSISKHAPGMMRPIRTKVGRHNQHMGLCLLVEVGNNANTMGEALAALPYLADALGEVVTFQK
jgi:stage II sporulation protein P